MTEEPPSGCQRRRSGPLVADTAGADASGADAADSGDLEARDVEPAEVSRLRRSPRFQALTLSDQSCCI